jgi:hypothetical protein
VRVTCAFCEVQYDLKQCDYDKKVRRGVTRFFCSTACRGKDYSARHAHPCKQCGAPIVGDRHRVYCSSACKAGAAPNPQQWRRSFAPRACGHCRYEFVPSSSRTRYCSQECKNAAHSQRMTGAGNSHFKDGTSYAKWFREMRPLIMERDGHCCVACKAPHTLIPFTRQGKTFHRTNLRIHHTDENSANNAAQNLVTLCADCHGVHHKSKMTPFPWFADYAQRASMSMTSRWKETTTSLQTKYSPTTASS